ncbi:MAG: hypothetical protein JXQ71_05205 [Verrucomicrobia bacterium]|nr:hypothetical protein [Verrucomicrobiota bacterium]
MPDDSIPKPNRFALLTFLASLPLLPLPATAATSPPADADNAAWDVGDRRQLFLDHRFVREASNVQSVAHRPRKTGEHTLVADRPWERGGLGPYSCVLKHGNAYKMWYHAMNTNLWDAAPVAGAICYATSEDGITWVKPDLGLVEYEGSLHNNIVIGHGAAGLRIGQDGMMVFADPNAPPNQRLRMVNRFNPNGEGKTDGINILSSADGIRWTPTHQNILASRPEPKGHHLDSQNVIFWDDLRKAYVAYVRRNLRASGSQGRAIARAESDQLAHFPATQDLPVVLEPEPPDPLHEGASVVDYYNSGALRYPWADDAYLLFPQAYYHYTRTLREFTRELPVNAGPLDTHFAASRDGIHWQRYDRQPFVPLGMQGEFDCHSARLIHGLVPDLAGREIYMYYRGSDWLHGWDRNARNRRILARAGLGASRDVTVFSRLVMRRDGFVSVRAGHGGGAFTTPPLRFTGRQLVLNVNTSATGYLRVGCLTETGQPIPGFGLADCLLIHTANDINRPVTWKGHADPGLPTNQPIRLQFEMRQADLYAFQFR